ncbi:MAG: hypothetical protein IH612_00830 [Desulfofustis sp.]|nr:hypothetical protein [Desulfofustis sp.]
MTLFLTTLLLTVPLLIGAALLINFCRRRVGRTRHGLTGMCHQSGGRMCGCCSASLHSQTDRRTP